MEIALYSFFPYRTEYDAYRSDLEYYNSAPKTEINLAKKTETEDVFNRQKLEFERLRSDVQIKLKFLDENRVIHLFDDEIKLKIPPE